ncbi:hypothetical protein BDA99DRAFT_501397 [Phascolomyces articulosus]|uniref:Uncharacterized protein n=1 Tax=Phascolomyces articulosus TaxID=60185 RepID=A0AAD5KIX3_9FUNG|nr:hypothetical protein BDA99DRAFT_501397 [Phascolomyces articulosus]
MIINPNDSIYDNKLTEEDLNEINDFNAAEFDEPLPKELHEYLYPFEGKARLVQHLQYHSHTKK